MSEIRKFLFDQSFDAPDPKSAAAQAEELLAAIPEEPEEPPPPPPPTFSEAELEMAKKIAFAEGLEQGFQDGKAQAIAAHEKALIDVQQSVAASLAELMSEQATRFFQFRAMTLDVALTVARKLLPGFIDRFGALEIETAVRGVIDQFAGEPRLVVRVHDSQLDALSERLEAEATRMGYEGKLIFMADPTLAPSDCRVEWADGGLERDTARIWHEIDHIAAQVLGVGQALPSATRPEAVSSPVSPLHDLGEQ